MNSFPECAINITRHGLDTINPYIHLKGLGSTQSANHLANEINQGHSYVKRENNQEKIKWCNTKKNNAEKT